MLGASHFRGAAWAADRAFVLSLRRAALVNSFCTQSCETRVASTAAPGHVIGSRHTLRRPVSDRALIGCGRGEPATRVGATAAGATSCPVRKRHRLPVCRLHVSHIQARRMFSSHVLHCCVHRPTPPLPGPFSTRDHGCRWRRYPANVSDPPCPVRQKLQKGSASKGYLSPIAMCKLDFELVLRKAHHDTAIACELGNPRHEGVDRGLGPTPPLRVRGQTGVCTDQSDAQDTY